MRMEYFLCIVLVISITCSTKSARILAITPVPSLSHQIVFQPIWKELSLRGHQVTVITPNPLKDPTLTNLTEIDISNMYNRFEELTGIFSKSPTHWDMLRLSPVFAEMFIVPFFSNPQILSLINDTTQKFDVVIAEYIFTYLSAFSYKFKCPLIGIASLGMKNAVHEFSGNPVHPVLYPELTATYGDHLSFFERVDSVLYTIYYRFYQSWMITKWNKLLKVHFGNDVPSIEELERTVSMLFLNTNPVIHKPRPYGPNTIQMGRMHIKPKKPLPKDLKDFLDSAKEGVIYFSLGSNVQSVYIDKMKRKLITETFSELPYKILWKFEDDYMQDKPDNVKINKWLPQQDLLGHPNIKLFITQAGLQSTEEAIVNKVPVIGIPFFADQHFNAKRYVTLGIGKHLDFATLTKDQFKNAILEVTQNPKYKEKVSKVADILTDEPESGLQRAVWWTEYVIRHNGAPYFRSPALDIPLYQYYLLDVISFFIVILLLLACVSYILIRWMRNSLKLIKTSHKCKPL